MFPLSKAGLFIVLLFLMAFGMFAVAVTPLYNMPPDSIYLAVGPFEEGETISVSEFKFIVYLADREIEMGGIVEFTSKSTVHYFDLYLPFAVTDFTNQSNTIDFDTRLYRDTVDARCSLIHADVRERVKTRHGFHFHIYVQELAAVKQLGEERVILTFGYPALSTRFRSLHDHLGNGPVGISGLVPFIVTIVVDGHQFFSSDTYPPPDVEYLTTEDRIATWLVQFSGPLSSYYRSIDCTVRHAENFQIRQWLVFFSGAAFSLGGAVFVRRHFRQQPMEPQPKVPAAPTLSKRKTDIQSA